MEQTDYRLQLQRSRTPAVESEEHKLFNSGDELGSGHLLEIHYDQHEKVHQCQSYLTGGQGFFA